MKFVIFAVFSLNLFAYGLPVCERTQQVKDAIVNTISVFFFIEENLTGEVKMGGDCSGFVDYFLKYIKILDLKNKGITSLKVGDFAGLSFLNSLDLSHNNLSVLPANVFLGLSSLKNLNLGDNNFRTLPYNLFEGLSLKNLNLGGNNLLRSQKNIIRNTQPHVNIKF